MSALEVSHGQNRGSSPLGSANKINDLLTFGALSTLAVRTGQSRISAKRASRDPLKSLPKNRRSEPFSHQLPARRPVALPAGALCRNRAPGSTLAAAAANLMPPAFMSDLQTRRMRHPHGRSASAVAWSAVREFDLDRGFVDGSGNSAEASHGRPCRNIIRALGRSANPRRTLHHRSPACPARLSKPPARVTMKASTSPAPIARCGRTPR
jgi:hypothetical protein